MSMSEQALHHAEDFRAGRALGLDHRKLGMWLFIASEVMFFGGLIAAFQTFKLGTPSAASALLNVAQVGVNTFVLLTSSFTVVLALSAIRAGDQRGLRAFLGLTILLGAAFLSGQAFEFASLYREGLTLTSGVFGSSFFTLTGFQRLPVFLGVAWA